MATALLAWTSFQLTNSAKSPDNGPLSCRTRSKWCHSPRCVRHVRRKSSLHGRTCSMHDFLPGWMRRWKRRSIKSDAHTGIMLGRWPWTGDLRWLTYCCDAWPAYASQGRHSRFILDGKNILWKRFDAPVLVRLRLQLARKDMIWDVMTGFLFCRRRNRSPV